MNYPLDRKTDINNPATFWRKNPNAVFELYMKKAAYSQRTMQAYRPHFARFAGWLNKTGLSVHKVSTDDITRYIDSLANTRFGTPTEILRCLNALGLAYKFLNANPNPALVARKQLHDQIDEKARFEYLPSLASNDVNTILTAIRSGIDDPSWHRCRDHAIVAVMLYAGLTFPDTRRLKINDIVDSCVNSDNDGALVLKLKVGLTDAKPYQTILRPHGVKALRHWLSVRANSPIESEFVFHSANGRALTEENVFAIVSEVLDLVGIITPHQHRKFILRNTFAIRECRWGTPQSEIASSLGISLQEAERYQAVAARQIGNQE